MLLAYFDESMSTEGMNHREVGVHYILYQYEFRMISQQYLSGDLFSYTNGAYEIFSLVLCCEVFKFWVKA